ncbi:MAG TPA: twin-arginine translocase TatA/TatE family subunit [Anaeromyxobacteraceae bacterium]|nr:twin-arginine translocase TatA/TatE family subunit [Anaeromyxobacteraceae bacterium]
MFGLGFGEILIILVLALILLGPQRLPDVAKQLGRGLRDFKKATDDLRGQFERELYSEDRPKPKPALVQPPAAPPVPAQPPGSVPSATADNVSGLEAAVAVPGQVAPEPPPTPEAEPPPTPETAPAPGETGQAGKA